MSRDPLPARVIHVPAGYVLTNEEIGRAIEALNQRVARGEVGFDVARETPEWYALKVPVGTSLTRDEIVTVVELADRAKRYGHADLLITWSDGVIVKRWTTIKTGGAGDRVDLPAAGGISIRTQF